MFPPKTPEWPVEVAYDELPTWMRSARRTVDWPLVAALVMVAVLVAPMVSGPLPFSAGLRSEVARALEMSESIQAGILYPRWAPDFNLGYGAPLWNFLPPLPHYLAGLHRVLAQTSAEFSVRFTLIAAQILLALALFGFVRRRWGTYGGLLAAALGLFSPQIALVKPLIDGDLGGLLAAGCWLASLWALDRLLATGRGASLLLAAGACAAVWLAHQPLNLLFSALTLAWLLFRLRSGQPGDAIRAGLLAYALGFAASAFYWLPAWSERDLVIWRPADGAQPAATAVSLRELFGAFPPLDRTAINPPPVAALGVALWIAAAIALLLLVARRVSGRRVSDREREELFFGLVGALLLAGAVAPVGDVWASTAAWPPFRPAELVFPGAICLALFGASLGWRLEFGLSPRRGVLGMLALGALIAVTSLPLFAPPPSPSRGIELTPAGLIERELSGVPLAAREPGWLLPRGVTRPPAVESQLLSSFESGMLDKVRRDNLPATTLADTIEHTAQRERIMLRSAGPAEITLRTFLFSGWRAELDGQPLALHATETGLIALHVPGGDHELVVSFGSTAARAAGWLLSGAACLLLLGLAVRQEHHPRRAALPSQPSSAWAEPVVLLGMLGLLMGAALVGRVRSEGEPVTPPVGSSLPGRFQGGLDLLAAQLAPPVEQGAPVALTLTWRGWRPDLPDYQVDLLLIGVDDPARVYSLAQRRHPGQLPSSEWTRWSVGEHTITDAYTLAIPYDVPPGRYRIAVQIGRCSHLDPGPCPSMTPVFAQSGDRASLEQSLVLDEKITIAW